MAAVEEIDALGRGPNKVRQGQHGGARLPMGEAAAVVILSALGHLQQLGGETLEPHILRHTVQQSLPDGGKPAQIVPPDLSARGLGQGIGGEGEPLFHTLRRTGRAGVAPIKAADAVHTSALLGHGIAPRGLLQPQRPISPAEGKTDALLVLFGKPETEARRKVVIPGNIVVEAQTLRAAADQPHGDAALVFGKLLVNHGPPIALVTGPGLLKSLHRSPSPFPSAPWHRGRSQNNQSWERTWRW